MTYKKRKNLLNNVINVFLYKLAGYSNNVNVRRRLFQDDPNQCTRNTSAISQDDVRDKNENDIRDQNITYEEETGNSCCTYYNTNIYYIIILYRNLINVSNKFATDF